MPQKTKNRRRWLRIRMRRKLHGSVIAIPRNLSRLRVADILKQELVKLTPVDSGKALSSWFVRRLANGDMRVINEVGYIRRLMIDGYSKQTARGAYLKAIRNARQRILKEALARA